MTRYLIRAGGMASRLVHGGDESGYETGFVFYVFCGFTSDVGNNLLVAFSAVFTKVIWLHTVGQSLNGVLMGE